MTLFDNPFDTPARKPEPGAVSPDAVASSASTTPAVGGEVVGLSDQAGVRRPVEQPRKAADGYYNTTNLTGKALESAKRDARTQQDRIRLLFDTMGDTWTASPSKVHSLVGGKAPLTSIRRAMTVLTDEGYLTRTETKMTGPFGKAEHVWRRAVNVRRAA